MCSEFRKQEFKIEGLEHFCIMTGLDPPGAQVSESSRWEVSGKEIKAMQC